MKLRNVRVILWSILLVLGMTGCGRQAETERVEAIPADYEGRMNWWKDQANTDSITCWYTSETDLDWLENAAQGFEQEYGIRVEAVYYDGVNLFADMNQASQNGSGPDVYLVGNDQLELAWKSGMAEENTWLDDTFWQNNYPEVAKQAVTYGQKQYGYPVYFDTYCLVYDANLLQTAPASIDDILAFLDEYEDTGSTKAIFRWDVADPYINTMFFASYVDLFGENGDQPASFQVNNEKAIETMEYFQSLSEYLWMNKNNISHDTVRSRIKDKTLVLGLCKSDILPTLYEMQAQETVEAEQTDDAEEEKADYRISYVPSLTAGLSSTTLSTTYAALVNPYGTDTSIANMFGLYLSYGIADQQYAGNGKLSVRTMDGLDEMQTIIYAQYVNSKPVPKVMVLGDYLAQSGIAFDAIWSGKDVKEQLEQLQSAMEQKIK
ncbi:MAG: extracellular solute-binding protein [Lachnospiraceae bacterium]|nr:extracellular solute-binding protein [Lachnospiraceae bacterium]